MKKYILCFLFVFSLLLHPAFATEPVSAYSDLGGDEWFASAVAEMTRLGIMSGVRPGIFDPYAEVTRGTVVAVLWRMEGSPELPPEIVNSEDFMPFPDAEDWYYTAASWAKYTGIASGYAGNDPAHPAGTFGGRDPVTREQLAVFLYNYASYKGQPIAQGIIGLYSDAHEVDQWAEIAVRHAVGTGILQGNDANRLNPRGVANRASLAVTLTRMIVPAAG